MFFGNFTTFQHTFTDDDTRYDDDELLETVAFVEFKDRLQIDIGFSCHGPPSRWKVTALEFGDFLNAVRFLNAMNVFQESVVRETNPVREPKFCLEPATNLKRLEGYCLGL